MADPFSRLQKLSNQLNESSDLLNHSVAELEAQFAQMRLGIEVWAEEPVAKKTVADQKSGIGYEEEFYFGYAKKPDGKWGLCIQKLLIGPDVETRQPFDQAPRSLRLKALEKLPSLIKQFEKEAIRVLNAVEKARKLINSELKKETTTPLPHEL
jgi:predicted nuclease with TOPRIM domain